MKDVLIFAGIIAIVAWGLTKILNFNLPWPSRTWK